VRKSKLPCPPGPPTPGSIRAHIAGYLESLRIKGFSDSTLHVRTFNLGVFADWTEERGITKPQEVTRPILERYQRTLFYYRKKDGRPLGASTQQARLVSVRSFFKWLVRQDVLLFNPASEIDLPKGEDRLPHFLTESEVGQVLNRPDLNTPTGIRDRAMLEVLYCTGMRRKELAELTVFSIDAERLTVTIRKGKGKKDRMIPIASRAVEWVEKYLEDARPKLVVGSTGHTLFVSSKTGQAFELQHLSDLVSGYIEDAGINKPGACHLFRHTMATAMLEGGADTRFIQQMLGHADLKTTQIYTQVSITKLQQVYSQTHPAAKGESATAAAVKTPESDPE